MDFTQRIDTTKVNKRVVENLIKCGAMDCFGNKRSQLMAIMDKALEIAAQKQKDKISGQMDLFGSVSATSAPIEDKSVHPLPLGRHLPVGCESFHSAKKYVFPGFHLRYGMQFQ